MRRIEEVLSKREQILADNIEAGNYRCSGGSPTGACFTNEKNRMNVTSCDSCGKPVCRACARLKLVNKKNDLSVHHNWCLPKKEQRCIKIGDDY